MPTEKALKTHQQGFIAQDISKTIGQKFILKSCHIHVQQGEAVGLLGPNGAGKTTFFSILAGLMRADAGSIMMDGVDISTFPAYVRAKLGIAYLPQEPSIFRSLTVAQNIMAVLELAEANPERRDQQLEDLLAEFSITRIRTARAATLSGGERRRTEIARALAARPRFILLDEPLAGIDPIAVSDIRNMVTYLKNRGMGVLITDHNVRDTLRMVDRAYIISEGGILTEGSPQKIIKNKDVRRVYLGETFSL